MCVMIVFILWFCCGDVVAWNLIRFRYLFSVYVSSLKTKQKKQIFKMSFKCSKSLNAQLRTARCVWRSLGVAHFFGLSWDWENVIFWPFRNRTNTILIISFGMKWRGHEIMNGKEKQLTAWGKCTIRFAKKFCCQ